MQALLKRPNMHETYFHAGHDAWHADRANVGHICSVDARPTLRGHPAGLIAIICDDDITVNTVGREPAGVLFVRHSPRACLRPRTRLSCRRPSPASNSSIHYQQ